MKNTFRKNQYYQDGTSASDFCEFITEKILPRFEPEAKSSDDNLFRFLILLMPVDSSPDLNSESLIVFQQLLRTHPAFGMELLRKALDYNPNRHRAQVWRLLGSVAPTIAKDDSLVARARKYRECLGAERSAT